MKQELNTILAALRLLQRTALPRDLVEVLRDGGVPEMTDQEVDKLCEHLNCGVGLYVYVRVYLRPEGHPKGSPQPAFTHTFVQADTEDTAYHLGNLDPFDAALTADGYLPANDYVIACGPMLQHAHADYASLVVVCGGVAEIVDGSAGNIQIIDFDNIKAGDPPVELPRGEGFEELVEGADYLVEGEHFKWEDA